MKAVELLDHEILCYIGSGQNLYHASNLYTGLCELARRGKARVRFVVPRGEEGVYAADPVTVCLRVKAQGVGERLLVVDLRDRSDIFTEPLLERSDLYLKRSFHEPDLAQLPAEARRKVVPFGLNFACRSRASTRAILRALAPGLALDMVRSPGKGFGRLNPRRSVLYQYLTTAREREFEQGPEHELEPTVLFQTRVYKPEHVYPDDPAEINEGRVRLVRALKRAFGPKFRGGLVPTAYAVEHYPNEVSEQPTRQAQYIAWGKRSLVGVYTRGLYHSLAFKLPEYLAASKCIVSEPLRNTLPEPLVAGEHYVEFGSPEECVEQCARLLEDKELAVGLRRRAWEYYRREVEPAAHLESVLRRASRPECFARPSRLEEAAVDYNA